MLVRGLCLCLLAATLLPTAAARSCVSAYAESGGAHITRDSDSSTTHLAVCSVRTPAPLRAAPAVTPGSCGRAPPITCTTTAGDR